MWIVYSLAALALVAALSGGLALGLNLFRPNWTQRRRISWSAALATFLPMSLPLIAFLYEANEVFGTDGQDFILGLVALLLLTLVIGAVICLPAAWLVDTRLEKRTDGSTAAIEARDTPEILPLAD